MPHFAPHRPASSAAALALPRVAFQTATVLSYVLNPLVLPAVLFGAVLLHLGAGGAAASAAATTGLVFFCLLPLTYLGILIRRGTVASLEVRDRSKRTGPFLVGSASALLSLPVFYAMDLAASPLLMAMTACMVVNSLVMLAINTRWKISVHMAGLAGFVGMLGFVALAYPSSDGLVTLGRVVLAAALVPLLMWARVRSHAHTWGQVAAGTAFGLAASALELWALMQLGWI
jgi:hypothetical protein